MRSVKTVRCLEGDKGFYQNFVLSHCVMGH